MEKLSLRLFVPVLCFICFTFSLKAQTIRYIRQGGGGDGSSWAHASGNFQAMIDASAVNDEVWVAAGDYQTSPGTSYVMKEGVKIFGGFPNTGNPAMADRNWTANISRLIGRPFIENGPASCRVISNVNNGLTTAAVLDGFTVFNGFTMDNGGGMLNHGASPTIRNCIFKENNAIRKGGGMHNYGSNPVLINCVFSDNVCGLFNSFGSGAGMSNDNSNPTITHCEFNNNRIQRSDATNGGGAMYNTSSTPVITDCRFSGNNAYVGGAVYNVSASPEFIKSSFSGNTSAYRGGGIFNETNSNPIFRHCIFSGNNSTQGGGIANSYYSSMQLINCLLYGNSSQYGGALYNDRASIHILNSTIANNSASSRGGAIESEYFIPPNAPDNLIIKNTIIAGNTSGVYLYDNAGKVINSLVQNVTPNSGTIRFTYTNNADGSLDPKFLNPSDPDGADNIFGTADDGYSLQAVSPVINLGSNAEVPADLTTDLAGGVRVQGTAVDIGAYENPNFYNCGHSTLYVDGARTSSGEGGSWATAFRTLREAMDRAENCNNINTILVAKGTYYPTGQQNYSGRDMTFLIPSRGGIKIYGGYPNGGGTRDLRLNPTVLSGDIGAMGDNSDNSCHIIVVTGISSGADSVVIDGFTLTKANADGGNQFYYNSVATHQNEGGGILLRQNNNFSKLAIRNCDIKGNSATFYGAGIYCGGTSALISNCVSTENTGVQNGGGFFAHAADNVRIAGSVIAGNSATNGSAIFALDARLQVVNCSVAGNTSGINNAGSSNTSIINSIFWNNGTDNIQNSATLAISYSNMQQASGVYSGAGNINADPLFVNAASSAGADGVWRTADDGLILQAGSLAVNGGTPDITGLPVGNIDLPGQPRIYAGRVDMGAYESSYVPCSETAGVLYVDAAVAQSGNGSSWGSAFKTLEEALITTSGCSNVNTILIAEGTYYPANTANRDAAFVIPSRGNLKIYGGYPSAGGARDIVMHPTILSGDIGAAGNNSDNSYHVMVIANINAGADSIVVDGVSFTNANANGGGSFSLNGYSLNRNTGGGLLIARSNGNTKILIRNCRSFNNRANQGAGIFNQEASPVIMNTILQGNFSTDNGGGMSNYTNANPTLINMLITGNRAAFAGAVFNDNSSPVFINSTIADNFAGEAGGTYNRGNGVNVIFRNSIIYGNRNGSGAVSNIYNAGNGTVSCGYSLVETGTGAWDAALGTDNGNNIFQEPRFVSRNEPNTANTPNQSGDYSLLISSPVIDAGNNALLPAGAGTDLSGAVRVQHAAVDMGAYENPNYNCLMFAFTIATSNIKCLGTEGGAVITIDKGVAPFTYNWSNGANTATVTNLAAGDYSCFVYDANGCGSTKNITITGPATALALSIDQQDINCFGAGDGTASANASGGVAPYSYSWAGGGTASNLTALAPGTYTCTVTDAAGCEVTKSVNITQPAEVLSATTSQTDILCFNGSTGVAAVVAAGGTAPYTYSWSNGATTASVSGLMAGNYTCTITDAANCAVQKTITIVQPAAALAASSSHTSLICFNGNNGTASVSVSGGTAPYNYSWGNGSTDAAISNLSAGDYTCTITDANGCINSVDVTITQPAAELTVVKTQTDINCFSEHTGAAGVAVSGGVAPYAYLWTNGATTSSVTGVAAGTYSCTITDDAGCSVVSNFIIAQPASSMSLSVSQTNIRCYGVNDGVAEVAVSGGTAPYNYSWSNGATTSAVSGITTGAYSCAVTDGKGCTMTSNFNITGPAAVLAVAGSRTDLTCYNGNNGAAGVTVSGGTAPYNYSWSNGGTTTSVNNLAAGNYTCTVTDANGCVTSTDILVEQPAATITVIKSQVDINCYGLSTGSAILNVSGGVTPYSYNWNNGSTDPRIDNINEGSYSCNITDANGCSVTADFVITAPAAALTHTFSQTNILCKNENTGSAAVSVSGGVAPYDYLWTTASTGATATGLSAGIYNVLVTDANGCTTGRNFTITEPTQLNAQVVSITGDYCNSGRSGTATVQGDGGVFPYSYLWSNGTNVSSIAGVAAGSYTCVVTDANGCSANTTLSISGQAFAGNKVYVDSSIVVPGDGSSWTNAVNEFSDAMKIAASCTGVQYIMVAKGTYKPVGRSGGNNRDSSFLIRQSGGLKMYGGYPSGGGQRNIEINATILSAEIGADWNNADNSSHIMVMAGLGTGADSVVIDGFTITGGYAVGTGTFNYNGVEVSRNGGGGIFLVNNTIDAGKIAIRNCSFTDNFTFSSGGAIYSEQSSPVIIASRFLRNIGVNGAGAILNFNSSNSFITLCEFSGNEGDAGGAVHNSQNSHARIDQCRFLGNAASMGGAITNQNSAPTITNCFIAGNRAYTTLGGGGIFNNNASPVIINTHFVKNNSLNGSGGGMSNFFNSSPIVINCNFYINEGWNWTGGIYNDGSHLTITNSIVYDNTGGITNMNGSTTSANYSLLQYWTGGGTGNLNTTLDPMFVSPAYNAPYTQGDYRLQPCSPAINAGTTDTTGLSLPLLETTDLPRIQLGRIDIGPTEANSHTNESAAALPVTATSATAWQLNNGTTWYGVDCQTLIAAVTGSGTHPVSGNTTVSVDMDATLLPGTVSRVYEITPDNDAAIASGTITLYFTQAEFSAYNTANASNNKLPLPDKDDPQMNDDFGNIRIRKVSGGVTTIITPTSVNWNAGSERWELTFNVSGFSKFYLFTQDNTSLPLRLISFEARAENCTARISWRTAEESGVARFELEQSADAQAWVTVSTINARNTAGEHQYNANVSISHSLNFYRLKMVDIDGTITYSKIVRLIAPLNCSSQNLKLYPNPVMDVLYIEKVNPGDLYSVYDNAGRILLQGTVSKTIQEINVRMLVMGTYMITIVNKQGAVKALKFVKK